MSRKNTIGPEYFRLRDDERLQRTHEAMVDFINDRHPNRSLLDALSFGYRTVPELDRFAAQFTGCVDSSDEDYCDYDDDNDKYGIRNNNKYCGFNRNFLDRGLPDPSKHVTAEEAERNAKALVDEEEKLKKKAEKKKQKKMRQKERRRLEKLEKENADKEKDEPVQVDPGSEKTKHPDKDKNENEIKKKTCSSVPSGPQRTSAPVQSSDSSSDEEDNKQKVSTMEPEELDMNSCFVSNAAAIAKRKLEQKPKPDKKPQASSRKRHESEEKVTTTPQKQIDNKESSKSEETVNANYFITKSVEMAVLGNQYASSGDMEMAVKHFTEAIKHNPKEYKLFGNRSYCYEKMFEYEKALNDADIALTMNPKWIKGLYRKGKALVGLKRYFEARLTYGEVLKLDSSCKDAAEEIMRVQLVQLMEMGFTKQQSSNALILHGTVEKALESLSGLPGIAPVLVARENEFMTVDRHPQPPAKFPLRPLPQNQPQPSMPASASVHRYTQGELFPIWVGDLVSSITEAKLYKLFSFVGQVHSVRVLQMRHCAFVNYTNKEDCEKAIQDLNGYAIDGTTLVVRYPDRIHTRLGVSRDASTESPGKTDKQPDECYFWRTSGCLKNDRCTYKHIPENKGVDLHKAKSYI